MEVEGIRIDNLELQLAETRKQMEEMMQSMRDAFAAQMHQVQSLFQSNNVGAGHEQGGTSNHTVTPVTTQPPPSAASVPAGRDGVQQSTHSQSRGINHNGPVKVPKFGFPHFTGENPRSWICKCQKYFHFHPMSDNYMILTAAMYMEAVW